MVKYLLRPIGQAVKTPPSHGGNRGSIPLRAAPKGITESGSFFSLSSFAIIVSWRACMPITKDTMLRGSYERFKTPVLL